VDALLLERFKRLRARIDEFASLAREAAWAEVEAFLNIGI
jgi:hypothetical protein